MSSNLESDCSRRDYLASGCVGPRNYRSARVASKYARESLHGRHFCWRGSRFREKIHAGGTMRTIFSALLACLLWTSNLAAQTPFYEGKTIRIVVGLSPGA